MSHFPNISFTLVGSTECRYIIYTLEMINLICSLDPYSMSEISWELLIPVPVKTFAPTVL